MKNLIKYYKKLRITQYSNNVQERIINRRVDSETNDFSVGDTALYYACEKGHEEVVKKLLNSCFANKIDMNQSDRENGITPLFAACFYNHVGIVKLLLSRPDKIDVLALHAKRITRKLWKNY